MSQGLQLNMLLGSSDITLKADAPLAEGEEQEHGLVFGEMLGEIVQPGKKSTSALTSRQLTAGISVLNEISQALVLAKEADGNTDGEVDAALTESLLGQIALKANKKDAKSEVGAELSDAVPDRILGHQQKHNAGDEDLKTELLNQLPSELSSESTEPEVDPKATRKATQEALAKGEVQPENLMTRAEKQQSAAVNVSENVSEEYESLAKSDAAMIQQSNPSSTALKSDADALVAAKAGKEPLVAETKVQTTAAMVSNKVTDVEIATKSDASADNDPQYKLADSKRNTAEVLQSGTTAESEKIENAIIGTRANNEQGPDVAKRNQNGLSSIISLKDQKAAELNNSQRLDSDINATLPTAKPATKATQENTSMTAGQSQVDKSMSKLTSELSAQSNSQQNNSQQQNSAQQFATMTEQYSLQDSQQHSKGGPEVVTTIRNEPSFMQQSHVTEQRQNNAISKVVAKTATEQLKQSLNLQHQDAASQLRQRVSLMVRQNIQVAEVRLDPAGLGQMQIKIDMQQDQAQVQFVVQQPQAKELLEQQLPRLRELLQQQGIVLTEGNVQQQSQQERQLAQRDSQHSATNSRGDDIGAEPDMPDINVQISTKINDRLVDYYA